MHSDHLLETARDGKSSMLWSTLESDGLWACVQAFDRAGVEIVREANRPFYAQPHICDGTVSEFGTRVYLELYHQNGCRVDGVAW